MASPFPFSDEVIQFLVLLAQNITERELRGVIQASEDAAQFAVPRVTEPLSGSGGAAGEFVALLELRSAHWSSTMPSHIIATADPASTILQSCSNSDGTWHAAAGGGAPVVVPVSCTLISRRQGSTQRGAPLSIKDLHVQSIDLHHPFSTLENWLQSIYEPLLRLQRHHPPTLHGQVQDLLSGIRSLHHDLPDADICRFVPPDLLELCASNPGLDVPQLVDRLGELARDPSYIRHVLEVRNRCTAVLLLDHLLAGNGGPDQDQDDGDTESDSDSGGVVRERLTYWRHVHAWVEGVAKQLQSREWRLMHRLLGSRVETNYTVEYAEYSRTVRGYIKYLERIQEKKLMDGEATLAELGAIAEEVFTAAMPPVSAYPAQLTERLLNSIVRRIAAQWVRQMDRARVLIIDEAVHDGGNSGKPVLAALQTLRAGMGVLRSVQSRYMESISVLRGRRGVVLGLDDPQSLEHTQLAALYRRCVAVRELIEQHFLLMAHLQQVFVERVGRLQRPGGAGRDAVGVQHLCGVKEAYEQCARSILSDGVGDVANAAEGRGVLWRVSPRAQERFEAATCEYHTHISRCDEEIAALVAHLLSAEHSAVNPAGASPLPATADRFGLHLFHVFASFRFLRLPRVQRVVRGYAGPLAEKVLHHFKCIQEEYFSVKMAKRETRVGVTRYHLSPLMAQVLWDRRLEESLRQCLVRHDYLMENGWHHLLSLRNIEHYWRLDEAMARCFGLLVADLVTPQMKEGSVVHGSAYALAYLQLFHAEDELEWLADPHLPQAEQLVRAADPTLLQAAKDRLIAVGAGSKRRDRRDESRDMRSMLATIAKRHEEKVLAWSEEARRHVAPLQTLHGPIFRVLEAHAPPPRTTLPLSPERSAVLEAGGGGGGSSGAGLRADVAFPWELLTVAEDLRAVEGSLPLGTGPCGAHIRSNLGTLRELVHANEGRGRLAQCLADVLGVYYITVADDDESLVVLATEEYRAVNRCIQRGFALRWVDGATLLAYAQQLTDSVLSFTHAVQQVRVKTEAVQQRVRDFHRRAFHPEAIVQRVKEVRHIVDALSLGCVHAHRWIRRVQPLLDAALQRQVQFLLHGWTLDFRSMRTDARYLRHDTETEVFRLKPLRVGMRVVYREVRLESPAAAWRSHWLAQLNRYFTWIDALPHLHNDDDTRVGGKLLPPTASCCLEAVVRNGRADHGYLHLMGRLPAHALEEPLQAIEECIADAIAVEKEWRRVQQFLDLDVDTMQQRFGNDLRRWCDALLLLRRDANRVMEYTQPNRLLGGIVIVAEEAQLELGRKLHQVSQYIHGKFKDVLEAELQTAFRSIATVKARAESLDVIDDIGDAATFLSENPGITRELGEHEARVALMTEAEATLQRLGYVLPEHWISALMLKQELDSLKDLVERRLMALQFRRPFLIESAQDAARALDAKTASLEAEFYALDTRTVRQAPVGAQQIVASLHMQAVQLREEALRVAAVQESLGMAPVNMSAIDRLLADSEALQEGWVHVTQAFAQLNALGATPLFEVVPRHLQEEVQRLEAQLESYPAGVRSYRVYEELREQVERVRGLHRLMQALRSDAMSPLERAQRHWNTLKQRLGVPWVLRSLTVRDIWESDPAANAAVYNDVLEMAQGERRIEVQLQRIAAYWEAFQFSLTVHSKQVALVRGWDAVFERLADDLATFSGIRASPYFTAPHLIALARESEGNLNALRKVLETLLEVQKRWVYMDSVFSGNAEIRLQLPHDAAQFDRTTREFLRIFPRPRTNGALPVVGVQFFLDDAKLPSTLERLLGQLTAVQRALTAYLDAQRGRFPRFFFVGDDDLLEILGSCDDPCLLGRHLRKMFSAVAAFTLDGPDAANSTALRGFASLEGEAICFKAPVVFRQRALHEWLTTAQDAMVVALRESTADAVAHLFRQGEVSMRWLASFPAQVVVLALQIWWVQLQEGVLLANSSTTVSAAATMEKLLVGIAGNVLDAAVTPSVRFKCEQVSMVAVYQRDVSRSLALQRVTSCTDFEWLCILRPYLVPGAGASGHGVVQEVECRMADAALLHGFEYAGGYERLVQTPLTDKCYLTLMQALHTRLGGSPVGPAGTGKTETVKALGTQLGRHVLVFNCDEAFDYQVISRLFLGLSQVGAWGCFDEFNRLEERILSALSQQIQVIQESLRARRTVVEMDGRRVPLRDGVAIFITMNPHYAGRSNLPGNLKQLFRAVTMSAPDGETIAEVMLFAQGFRSAETLAVKVAPLFRLCTDQLSRQAHYDFGLRALKAVLVAAGARKRAAVLAAPAAKAEVEAAQEYALVLESIIASVAPKLVTRDVGLFYLLLRDFFPRHALPVPRMHELRAAVLDVCVASGLRPAPDWVEKICQLRHTMDTRHGIMVVGPSGAGKTAAWKTLMAALVRVDREAEVRAYVIDPKVLPKTELFGSLDITTREWKDGVFTSILRRIGEAEEEQPAAAPAKQHWVVFDGDVDPEWVENLNSVLDDNHIFTLPNGERLPLPRSTRLLFEAQDLRYATPATVSRCGMVWFSDGVVSFADVLRYVQHQLQWRPVADAGGRRVQWGALQEEMIGVATATNSHWHTKPTAAVLVMGHRGKTHNEYVVSAATDAVAAAAAFGAGGDCSTAERRDAHPDCQHIQQAMVEAWGTAFEPAGLILHALELILGCDEYRAAGIMEFNALQAIESIVAHLLNGVWRMFCAENENGAPMPLAAIQGGAQRVLEYAVFWGFGAPMSHAKRSCLATALGLAPRVGNEVHLMQDVEVDYHTGEWRTVMSRVERIELTVEQVGANDTVIPTVDTRRHEELLLAWLGAGRSAILCGPPGSGKTMSIATVLRSAAEYDAVFLNFSSGTTVHTVIRAMEQYCEVHDTAHGLVMAPSSGKTLLLCCDEINLPALNRYGTQVVVQLLRQLIERHGFYRPSDNAWVTTMNIQVVGACNPPTDPGRVPLSTRFLRWAPVLFVDFPSTDSLLAIYGTYCRAILRNSVKLQDGGAGGLARAMVETYRSSQRRFTPLQQPHYLYSPRELSRWTRAIHEALSTWDDAERRAVRVESLVRLAIHEGLRVFADRLVWPEEREWTDAAIDDCFRAAFPTLPPTVFTRPMLYSTLLSHAYTDSPRDALRAYVCRKAKAFCEEELSTPLVVFDAIIDHVLRIDRVLRQPLGHILLAGSSGVGKTLVTRLVAWMGGCSVFWLKVHRDYGLPDLEEDLRGLLRRAGCRRERICFIFDESNIRQPSFLEYMNALLAASEIPGLFEGEAWHKLMQEIREATAGAAAGYLRLSSEQDLYRWFLRNVKEQLHVVFTINPSSSEFTSRAVASPALFNRCTVNWFGDWDAATLEQVARERLRGLALLPACGGVPALREEAAVHRAVVQALCAIHDATRDANAALRARRANQGTFITPRHFSDLVWHVGRLLEEKRHSASEQLQHLRSGLQKLRATADEVAAQQRELLENERRMAERGKQAQSMLERIVAETDVAQKEKSAAEGLRMQLQVEQARIDGDARQIHVDLAVAEPALKSAETALGTVRPEHLREIRAYATPPPMVKRTLEGVCTLLGERNSEDWDVVKGYIRRENFLASVMALQPDSITDTARDRVLALMRDQKFTVEAAYRASKAAGPLLQWVFAQVQFCDIFKRVAPMREEITQLIKEREVKVRALERTEREIQGKEKSLQQLKANYQRTTQEIAELQQRTAVASAKCDHAGTILGKLLEERDRWEEEIKDFDQEACTTLGDCLVCAAFLAYIGFFDEFTRQEVLLPRWREAVAVGSGIPVRAHLSVADYLVAPAERLQWERDGLPKDRLCVENATILQRCHQRYPFLIDPDGLGVGYLQRHYARQRIVKTTFSQPGYLKQLEMAVRFGYPIIVEDAELLDPAVAPLLSHEVHHLGGRAVTRIGAHDVDIAPTFRLFLLTRDSNFQPPPGLAGQVNVVNFTVTLSSLQSQCLHHILLHERPDVDQRQAQLLSLQGECSLKLRTLEQQLLTLIAESKASLLDDDALLDSLAQLKHEAARIRESICDSETSLQFIQQVEARYRPVAGVASRIFFALKRFSELSSFYRYNVRFLFNTLQDALHALPPARRSPTATATATVFAPPVHQDEERLRIAMLVRHLFVLVHRRVVRGLFQEDHLVLALRLAQLRSSVRAEEDQDNSSSAWPVVGVAESEWEWLLEGLHGGSVSPPSSPSAIAAATGKEEPAATLPLALREEGVLEGGSHARLALCQQLAKPALQELRCSLTTHAAAWGELLRAPDPSDCLDQLPAACFPRGATPVRRYFLLSLLLLFTRRDGFAAAAFKTLRLFFDGEKDEAPHDAVVPFFAPTTHDLDEVLPELSPAVPLVMIADASFDPSARVEAAAQAAKVLLRVVAMGSVESVTYADRHLEEGTRAGCWVFLKNIHLARDYINAVEKRLHFQCLEGTVHRDFRLFLTVERGAREDTRQALYSAGAAVPTNLLGKAVTMVYEPPPGIKSALLQTYGTLGTSARAPAPAPASQALGVAAAPPRDDGESPIQRLYLAASWLHAVIMERAFYIPLGWSQSYEYNDTEYLQVLHTVRVWTEDRTSTPTQPPVVSWPALRHLVAYTVYGGKVSNPFDQHILNILCKKVLSAAVFERDHCFVQTHHHGWSPLATLPPLDGTRCGRKDLLQWIESLPEGSSNLQWLGLPSSVARMAAAQRALDTIERLAAVQMTLNEECVTHALADIEGGAKRGHGQATDRHGVPRPFPALPGADGATLSGVNLTRWGSRLRECCTSWSFGLQAGLERLRGHPFVANALDAEEATRSNKLRLERDGAVGDGAVHPFTPPSASTVPPLMLALQREAVALVALLRQVEAELRELAEVCEGVRNPSSTHRGLMEELTKDRVPLAWAAHIPATATALLPVAAWVSDVQARAQHLLALAGATLEGRLQQTCVALGLLLSPVAFFTASKQQCARDLGVSLEQLYPQVEAMSEQALQFQAGRDTPGGGNALHLRGLTLFLAAINEKGQGELVGTRLSATLPPLSTRIALRWTWVARGAAAAHPSLAARLASQVPWGTTVAIPLYATYQREELLEVVDLSIAPGGDLDVWYERGVCLTAWSSEL